MFLKNSNYSSFFNKSSGRTFEVCLGFKYCFIFLELKSHFLDPIFFFATLLISPLEVTSFVTIIIIYCRDVCCKVAFCSRLSLVGKLKCLFVYSTQLFVKFEMVRKIHCSIFCCFLRKTKPNIRMEKSYTFLKLRIWR